MSTIGKPAAGLLLLRNVSDIKWIWVLRLVKKLLTVRLVRFRFSCGLVFGFDPVQ